jgi:hypothetical protein
VVLQQLWMTLHRNARAQSEQLQKRGFPVSSLYLGTLGGENGLRDTRVEWTEFTWLLITHVWVIFYLHIVTPPLPLPPLKKLRDAETIHPLRNWAFCFQILRNSMRNWDFT